MIAHPKVLILAGALGSAGSAMLAQGMSTTPTQIAWVLGGLVAIGGAAGSVIVGYLTVQGWVRRTAADEAKLAIDLHSKDAAGRTRNAVAEAIEAAGLEQARALKDHIHEERALFAEIQTEQAYQRGQNDYLIQMVEYLKGDSSPSVPRLPAVATSKKLDSNPGRPK
jgi:hypothetical protein